MSEVLILEFAGATPDMYEAVNKVLDVNVDEPGGDWPAPLEHHIAAFSEGSLVVVEVWESQAAQGEFMARLGPALAQVGVPEPTRMQWLSLLGTHTA